jgi:hypothetical protein
VFKNLKNLAGELHLFPEFDMHASGRAAAAAFMDAQSGAVSAEEALFHHGNVPQEFPQVDLEQTAQAAAAKPDLASSLLESGHGVDQLLSNLGQFMQNAFSGPAGIIGSLIGFIFQVFSSIAEGVCHALAELARAAEALAEETWRKSIEQMSTVASSGGGQSLELWNQAASTQTLAHALKSPST